MFCIFRRMSLNQGNIVYVLRSNSHPDRYYTGLTDNVERRLAVHNSGGSKHTAHLRPWTLVAFTTFANAESAAAFEQYLKTGSGRAFLDTTLRLTYSGDIGNTSFRRHGYPT